MNDEGANAVWLLATHLALLSFAAVGGGVIMLAPDIQRYVVEVNHWVTAEQFSAAYAIAQAAPGPNMMFVTMVGWQIGGWLGAIGATAAIVVPPATVAFLVARLAGGGRGPVGRFGAAVRNGLAPLSVGLLLAGAWVLYSSNGGGWRAAIAVLLTLVVMLKTRINPMWLILVGALAGIAGLIG
jgi:chromate transporter